MTVVLCGQSSSHRTAEKRTMIGLGGVCLSFCCLLHLLTFSDQTNIILNNEFGSKNPKLPGAPVISESIDDEFEENYEEPYAEPEDNKINSDKNDYYEPDISAS